MYIVFQTLLTTLRSSQTSEKFSQAISLTIANGAVKNSLYVLSAMLTTSSSGYNMTAENTSSMKMVRMSETRSFFLFKIFIRIYSSTSFFRKKWLYVSMIVVVIAKKYRLSAEICP